MPFREPGEPRAEEAEDAGGKRGQQRRAHEQKPSGKETEARQVPAFIEVKAERLEEDEQESRGILLRMGKVRIAEAERHAKKAVQQQGCERQGEGEAGPERAFRNEEVPSAEDGQQRGGSGIQAGPA